MFTNPHETMKPSPAPPLVEWYFNDPECPLKSPNEKQQKTLIELLFKGLFRKIMGTYRRYMIFTHKDFLCCKKNLYKVYVVVCSDWFC